MKILRIVKRIYARFSGDRIPAVAASITFFFLLALFPALTCIVSLYGLFADRTSIVKVLTIVSGFLPGGAVAILTDQVHRLINQKSGDLGIALLVSFALALWSASGGVKALIDGLNIAFETHETRGFFKLTWNALLFTVAGSVVASLAIYLLVAISDVLPHLPLAGLFEILFDIVAWPVGFLLCSLLLSVVYRFGPNRPRTPWKWISWGSGLASAAWMAGTVLFTWYVRNFGRYDRIYGDLGSAVGFLTWVWLSLVFLLTGAEIVAVLEGPGRDRGRPGTTAGDRR